MQIMDKRPVRDLELFLVVAWLIWHEGDKNRRQGLTGLTGPCPWVERK